MPSNDLVGSNRSDLSLALAAPLPCANVRETNDKVALSRTRSV